MRATGLRGSHAGRLCALALVACCGLALAAQPAPAPAAASLPLTQSGKALVVELNIREAFGKLNLSHIDTFTGRLLSQVPYVPDVVLLQEVRRRSARYAAKVMTSQSSHPFAPVVLPPTKLL